MINQLPFYCRYVDDILVFTESFHDTDDIMDFFNKAHPNIKFTSECGADNQIPFLDVLLKRRQDGTLQRSVYHKPTSSGQYLHFESSSPIEHKRALVKTLFHRARRICTSDTIDQTEENIKKDLASNSYPAEFIAYHSRVRPKAPATYDVARKPVYITLPFKGDTINMMIRKRLNATIQRTYPAARLRLLNRSRKIGPLNTKIKKSIFAESKCIYRLNALLDASTSGVRIVSLKIELKNMSHLGCWKIDRVSPKPPYVNTWWALIITRMLSIFAVKLSA